MAVTQSTGIKRLAGAVLVTLIGILSADPRWSYLVPYLSYLATALGVVSLAHAATAGTLGDFKTGSITMFLQIILQAAKNVPAFAPYLSIIQLIISLLGTASVTTYAVTRNTTAGN